MHTTAGIFALLLHWEEPPILNGMLAPELLALLVCPETHQDVVLATPGELALLNAAIRDNRVRTVAEKEVDQPVETALIRIDRAVAYPVRDGIPVMLAPEGLVIRQLNLSAEKAPLHG